MSTEETLSNTQEQTTPEQPADAGNPGLTLQDLVLVVQIIQLSSSRGAFRAEELQTIGALYNKMVTFLESTGALQRAKEEQPASEEAAQETA